MDSEVEKRARDLAAELRHIAAHADPAPVSMDRDAMNEAASLIERLCRERESDYEWIRLVNDLSFLTDEEKRKLTGLGEQ